MQFLVTSGPRPFLTPRSASQHHHSSIRAAQEPGVAQHRPDRDLRPASPSDLAADSSYVAPLPFQASVRTPSPALSFCARLPRLRCIPGTPAMRSGKTRRPEPPHRRGPCSQPCSASLGTLVHYPCRSGAPGPNHDPNRAPQHPYRHLRRAPSRAPGSSHTYIQQNEQYIIAHIT